MAQKKGRPLEKLRRLWNLRMAEVAVILDPQKVTMKKSIMFITSTFDKDNMLYIE